MQENQVLLAYSLLLILPGFFIIILLASKKPKTSSHITPDSYPLIASSFAILANRNRRIQWISDILNHSPTGTFTLHRPLNVCQIFTANPDNVKHILYTNFHLYPKGTHLQTSLTDFLGSGIFIANGDTWKFERKISSYEFNTKSLRKFVETVVESELTHRLLPMLTQASNTSLVVDLQDLLQRFAFDNICKIAFDYDPEYLSPFLPKTEFAVAFEDAVRISSERFNCVLPLFWKVKRFFNIGSEKRLKQAIQLVRGFALTIVKKKKNSHQSPLESTDILSRFLNSGHANETFVTDMVISFILAGRDTTSATLTWFFWLLSCNPHVEQKILKEIQEKPDTPVYDEVKDMVYIHAALSESMRIYPPVPVDTKEAEKDDVLPDGTAVKKGMRVAYHPYAMGRMETLWGADWNEFRPERWLEKDVSGKWSFVGRDPYLYPVFQAGPRVCLGKDMAFLQMKRMVSGILSRFRIVPVIEKGSEPVLIADLTSRMKGGFPVRIEHREAHCEQEKM